MGLPQALPPCLHQEELTRAGARGCPVASIHRVADKAHSRKPGCRFCRFSETPQPRSYWSSPTVPPCIGPASSVACEDKKKGRGDTLALANAGAVVGGQ